MRRPFIEAGPLLAAHGHTRSRPILFRRRPTMSQDVRFALLKSNPHAKPLVFPDVDALARHIQRERGTAAIDLEQVEDLEIGGDAGARPGVSVFTLDMGNDRDQLIGHVYLDGRGGGRGDRDPGRGPRHRDRLQRQIPPRPHGSDRRRSRAAAHDGARQPRPP